MKAQQVLEDLGFKPNEARIYLAVLEIGEITVSELARDLNLPRTTVQEIFDLLHKRGLLNYYLKKTRKFWVAENPQKLVLSLKERENNLNLILPELRKLSHTNLSSPKVSIYRGAEEIKLILEDIISTKQSIQSVVSWDSWIKFYGGDFVYDFIQRRADHFLRIELLTPRTKISSQLKTRDLQQLRRTRFLPEAYQVNNSNFIYGSKVAIISMNKKDPMGILIEDEDVAQTMKVFFSALWSQSQNN